MRNICSAMMIMVPSDISTIDQIPIFLKRKDNNNEKSPFLDLAPIFSLEGQAICVWVSSMIWNRVKMSRY